MELKNIEQAQKLFPDAVKLQLRVKESMTVDQVRRLLPSSVVLLSCKISKNYANVIYSEGAARRMFPDITMIREKVNLGTDREAHIYSDNKSLKVLVNFLPSHNLQFVNQLEMAFGKNMIQLSNYPEVNMGCLFFENVHLEDLIKVLTLCEDGEEH